MDITRRTIAQSALLIASAGAAGAASAAEEKKSHRISFQVSDNDPARMNLTLNNVVNAMRNYSDKGEPIEIEVVAYGPGLHMLRADDSPVKDRLKSMKDSLPDLTFSACENTLKGMEKAEGKKIEILPQARLVPAGVIRLTELQEQGWSYIRP